mgnify:CR=1 FL=1
MVKSSLSKIDAGEIVIEINGSELHFYLDNLVRVLASNEKSYWKTLIYEHFDKLKPKEIIKNGQNGFLVEKNNVKKIQ